MQGREAEAEDIGAASRSFLVTFAIRKLPNLPSRLGNFRF